MKRKNRPETTPSDGSPRKGLPPVTGIVADYLERLRLRLAEDRYPVDPLVVAEMIVARDHQSAEEAAVGQSAAAKLAVDDAAAVHAEVIAIVGAACAELPYVESLVLQLSVVEELTVSEIAAVIDEVPSYVASLRKIALGRLRLRIGDVIG